MRRVRPQTLYCYNCNRPAVVLVNELWFGDLIRAEDFLHVDGSEIHGGEEAVCDSCGLDIEIQRLLDNHAGDYNVEDENGRT